MAIKLSCRRFWVVTVDFTRVAQSIQKTVSDLSQ